MDRIAFTKKIAIVKRDRHKLIIIEASISLSNSGSFCSISRFYLGRPRAARLGCNGYGKKFGGDIFLDAITFKPVDPIAVDVSFDIKLQCKKGPGAPRGSGNRHMQKPMRR